MALTAIVSCPKSSISKERLSNASLFLSKTTYSAGFNVITQGGRRIWDSSFPSRNFLMNSSYFTFSWAACWSMKNNLSPRVINQYVSNTCPITSNSSLFSCAKNSGVNIEYCSGFSTRTLEIAGFGADAESI